MTNEVLTVYYTTLLNVEAQPIFDNFVISPYENTPIAVSIGIRDKTSLEILEENEYV